MAVSLPRVVAATGARGAAPAVSRGTAPAVAQPPLRVYLRSGPKSHGPGAHDYPRFLQDWVPLLESRGVAVTGGNTFPTRQQLDATDVLILHKQDAGSITDPTERANLEAFAARGGGVVVIHAGVVSTDPDWFKGLVGGSWRNGTTKWLEGPMHLYFVDHQSPITTGVSNWSMDDELYYDMDLLPEARVLAAAYTPKPAGARSANFERRATELTGGGKTVSIYDYQPQMWTYEHTAPGGTAASRAFVSIPGHLYVNFNRPNYRAILLRGIAWAGKRANVDELLTDAEKGDNLRYVEGGPVAPAKAAATIEIHPEFDLSLVASEPLISKAMNIDWDEKGRLWVSETPEYPNGRREPNVAAWKETGSLQPRTADRDPADTISILTDKDGDGVMDTRHVFADKLELVTGFVLYRNGVIAATAPDIWLLEDTNGDEVADKRSRLYTGLGINDTHAVINNLRWGLDGWIYATHGYSVGQVTSPDGSRDFGRDGSGVVRFKPDGSAFEQYSSRGGNTWGLDITWDGQVFWTQPTSGTVLFHTVLPEAVLAKARVPGTTSYKGMISGQQTYPLMSWTEQAYVQIDLVGQFTAAAGCAVYDGGAWPDRWRYAYFTGEPTLNIVHQQFVSRDGISYTTSKEPGREETEFMRSRDLWFRPIENRVGPDGALYVVDFYNQAVIHNDTRGPLHGPANAAVRPDRDHFFARIWRVQHKQARRLDLPALDRNDLPGLLRAIESSPNSQVRATAWRLAHEQHGSDPKVVALKRPMGSDALALYERTRTAASPADRGQALEAFAAATDNWSRSAIAAAATERPVAFIGDALRHQRSAALTDLVAAIVPAALPAQAGELLGLAASAPAAAAPMKASIARAVGRMDGGDLSFTPATTKAVEALLADPATAAAALPIVSRWDTGGALRAQAQTQADRLAGELGQPSTPPARRIDLAESLLTTAGHRSDALAALGALAVDPAVADPLRAEVLATIGAGRGADVDATLIGVLGKTRAQGPVLDQIMRRPETARALIAAMKSGTVAADSLGPNTVSRLRNHPDAVVASEAATYFDSLVPATARAAVIETLLPQVQGAGDAVRGKALFTGACGTCHKLGDAGQANVGPELTGMGTHSRSDLLTQILDPNREVDPSFWQWNITTRKGETLAGIVASENAASLTLRGTSGDVQISKTDIVSRENTRRSAMPEGFESLGVGALRDILTFLATSTGAGGQPPQAPAAAGPKEGGKGDGPLPETRPINWKPGATKVLIVAGGSSHDFATFFEGSDARTLEAAGFSVNTTQDRDQAAAELANADVAVISVNRQFFDTPAWRQALMDFAAKGKGLVMLHPGVWYGFADWPEINARIVGGGARGHDRLGPFTVNAVAPGHPVMQGVPASFEVVDELYYVNAEPGKIPTGTAPIEVLAETSPSQRFTQPHPSVWVTSHPTARIVGIALGHDARVHDLPAFQTLLVNAVKWVNPGTR